MILALKIIGWTLLAILVLVLLVLVVPLTFNVEYFQKQLRVRFRLIFPITIYPRGKKKKTAEKEEEKAPEPKEGGHVFKNKEQSSADNQETPSADAKEAEKKKGPKITLEMVQELLPEVSDTVKKLLKYIKIRKVVIILPIYHPDPMKNGEMVGHTWAAIGNLVPITKHIFNIEYNRIDVIPDFENQHNGEIMLAADITSSILLLIICVANLLFTYLRITKKKAKEN